MSEVFSILLHNRQRYEQGKEGLWFSLPTTTEKLQEALREIGISADNPQDFFLYDYRSPQDRPIKLPRDLVLSADVDELNFLAARLEKLDAAELAELNAALTSPQSDFHSIGQIIDYPDNVDYYVHLPDVTGTGQLGDYYLNRSGMVDMPEEWKAGIFLPRFGLHIANTEHGVFTDYGYLVKSGDEWQRVHEGQPVPEEYRVMAYPAPEILRDEAPAQTVQPEAAPTAEAAVPPPVVPIMRDMRKSIYSFIHTKPISSRNYVLGKYIAGISMVLLFVVILTAIVDVVAVSAGNSYGYKTSLWDIWANIIMYDLPGILLTGCIMLFISILFKNVIPAIPAMLLYFIYANIGTLSSAEDYHYQVKPGAIFIRFPQLFTETEIPSGIVSNQIFLLILAIVLLIASIQIWERRRDT